MEFWAISKNPDQLAEVSAEVTASFAEVSASFAEVSAVHSQKLPRFKEFFITWFIASSNTTEHYCKV